MVLHDNVFGVLLPVIFTDCTRFMYEWKCTNSHCRSRRVRTVIVSAEDCGIGYFIYGKIPRRGSDDNLKIKLKPVTVG